MLRSDTAQLAGLFVESVFYGIYLVTFGYCLQALFLKPSEGWRRRSEIHFGSVFVALSLFFVGTINLALAFFRIHDIQQFAFKSAVPGEKYVGLPWVNIVKASTMNLQVLIADSTLIYRCWHVYGKRWTIVFFPIVLWFGALAVTICMLWGDLKLLHFDATSLSHMVQLVCTIFWVCSMLMPQANMPFQWGMIVIRICRVDHMNRAVGLSSDSEASGRPPGKKPALLQHVIRIVVDSGLMYTAISLAVVFSQVKASTSVYITTSAEMIVIGIAFNLINIRVAKARTRRVSDPSDTEPKTLTILEFNPEVSLAAHEPQQTTSHSIGVNSLSGVHHVEMLDKESAETVV